MPPFYAHSARRRTPQKGQLKATWDPISLSLNDSDSRRLSRTEHRNTRANAEFHEVGYGLYLRRKLSDSCRHSLLRIWKGRPRPLAVNVLFVPGGYLPTSPDLSFGYFPVSDSRPSQMFGTMESDPCRHFHAGPCGS